MRRRPLSLLTIAAAAALVAVPVAAGAATAHRTASPAAGSRAVPGVLAGLARAQHLGAAPSSQRLTIGVGVAGRDAAAEKAAYTAMYDPKSPAYHHFLTPAQFDAAFGVSRATKSAVTSWLEADGLDVTSVADDGSYVTATGTVAQLDKRFAVHIGDYRDAKAGRFVANDVAPTVPASLPITAVTGLDTVQRVSTAVDQSPSQPQLLGPQGSFEGILTPQNLWNIYDQPASDEGEGQTMGIFGEGATDPTVTQLRLFERRFDLPKIPVQTVFTEPGQPASDTSGGTGGDETGNVEWYLDAQASTGMAPKAKELQLWFSNTLFDPDIAKSISAWVNTAACTPSSPISTGTSPSCAPMQMNASFGECETGVGNGLTGQLSQLPYGTELGDDLEPIAEPMLEKATMMGRTLFASAGDTGSGCPEVVVPVAGAGNGVAPSPVPITNYPCVSDYAVCVGGTVLDTDGPTGKGAADTGSTSRHNKRAAEVSWMDTGGGASHYLLQPGFQAKAKVLSANEQLEAPCLADSNGTPYPTGSVCRTVPDVSALSGNIADNGYFIYIDGAPGEEGGTSLSSPLTMGMWARIQAASAAATGNGFADETYYSHYGTADSTGNFFDVTCVEPDNTTGTCAAGGPSSTNGAYMAGKGYDLTSGLGVPDVGKLLTAVDGTQQARLPQPAQEGPEVVESTVTDTSPVGNAQNAAAVNPVRGLPGISPIGAMISTLPAVDLTKTTITTTAGGSKVSVTMTGPAVSETPDPSAAGGENFVYYWYEAATHDVYFLEASTGGPGGTSYSAGDTAGGFTANSAVTVTGSFSGHTLTMSAPLAELGHPATGSLLEDPAADTQATALGLVADYAAAQTTGTASRGQAVCVGGCGQAAPPPTTPTGSTAPTGATAPPSLASPTASRELAFTGLSAIVPIVALLLVAGGLAALLVRRRTFS